MPNPVKDSFQILTQQEGFNEFSIKVFDAMGHLILEKKQLRLDEPISTENWSSGGYVLIIESADGVVQKKLLK